MSLALDVENHLFQWDGYNEFLDQSLDGLDIATVNWYATEQMSDSSVASEPRMQEAMNDLYRQPVNLTSSPKKTSEQSHGSPVPPTQQTSGSNPLRKKSKGRPKIDPTNSQSAAERRRVQVRVAQQAYRNRKEASAMSLKIENEDLKDRLSHVNFAFDQLLDFTLKAGPSLSPQEIDTVHSLCKMVEKYRLPSTKTSDQNDNKTPGKKGTETTPMIQAFVLQPNPMEVETISLNAGNELSNFSSIYDDDSSYSLFQPTYSQDSLTGLFGTIQTIQAIHSVKVPTALPVGQLTSGGPIPFSFRLRHEALRRGYILISARETPFSLLCRAFKHCIFSDTREGIITRIRHLLHQSTKFMSQFMYQTLSPTDTDTTTTSEDFHPESFKKTSQTVDTPSRFSLAANVYQHPSDIGQDMNEESLESGERYVDVIGVENYLRDRGLNISTGSNFVTLPPSRVFNNTTNPTLFDEIRAGQEIKLSVSKLLHELLERVVCLDIGPGIQALEIDEAIRSTVMAAV